MPTPLEQIYSAEVLATRFPDVPPEAPKAKDAASDVSLGGKGMAVLDTLAGALKGATAATLGLPGDIESLVRLLTGGEQKMPTTEDIQKALPPVVPKKDKTLADLVAPPAPSARETIAADAEKIGEFLPVAPIAIAKTVAKKVGKKGAAAAAAAGTAASAPAATEGKQ